MFQHKCCGFTKIAGALVIIGAINWGLVGLGKFVGSNLNVVNIVFGKSAVFESIIYLLVGLAGLSLVIGCKCKECCKTEKGQ